MGKIFSSCEVKIDNKNEDGIGEILIKSDSIMMGYYENKEATDNQTNAIKEGESKAADMRVASKYGTTTLIESGAITGRDPSNAEAAATMQQTKDIMLSNARESEEYKDAQREYNETIMKGNFDIQRAVNLILEKLTGYSGSIPVEVTNK